MKTRRIGGLFRGHGPPRPRAAAQQEWGMTVRCDGESVLVSSAAVEGRRCATLADAIGEAAERHPENGFTFQNLEGAEHTYGFPALERETARRALALQRLGLQKGDRLGMVVILPEDFVLGFLAALRIGVVPVPLYPPVYLSKLDNYAEQTAAVLRAAGAEVVLVSPDLLGLFGSVLERAGGRRRLADVESLAACAAEPSLPSIGPDDLAFLQYTSGSTSDPKGVMVTHRSLVSNIHGFMGEGLRMVPGVDKGVSWLPLYHDMGLIGFVLGPVYWGVSVVFIPTLRFVMRPSVWLETIHQHRGTVSFGPNFSYSLVARKARPEQLAGWDLSCMKAFGCGAEPISPRVLHDFARLLCQHSRLRPTAVVPAYGLAESMLAVTMKPLEEEMRIHRVGAARFQGEGVARPPAGGEKEVEHVSCGVPFSGHTLAVLDGEGQPLPDRCEGEICVSGPSVTPGYFGDPELSALTLRGGVLHTGDIGYLHEGQLYPTGRIKDLIILNGRNVHPQSIEWTASEVDGVRRGNVVAFSRPSNEGEEIVVVIETGARDCARVASEVDFAVRRTHAVARVEVVCIEPGALPKTSSGKVKRSKVRQLYLGSLLPGVRA